jgi:hypothetical protein
LGKIGHGIIGTLMGQKNRATKQLENQLQRRIKGQKKLFTRRFANDYSLSLPYQVVMKFSFWRFSHTVLTTFCLLGLSAASGPESNIQDIELKIGIVQRFGDQPTAKLQLEPIKGDRLRLKFKREISSKSCLPRTL